MRPFEFHVGEVTDRDVRVLIIDLDAIEVLQEKTYEDRPFWSVIFAGDVILVTKPAFDRVMRAWKSQ